MKITFKENKKKIHENINKKILKNYILQKKKLYNKNEKNINFLVSFQFFFSGKE